MLSKYLGQEAFIREQQMAVQHKLDDQDPAQSKLDGSRFFSKFTYR
jgi:hypothetical protein